MRVERSTVINLWALCQVEARELDYAEAQGCLQPTKELPTVRDSFCLVAAGDKGNRSNRYEFRHRGTRRGRVRLRARWSSWNTFLDSNRQIDRSITDRRHADNSMQITYYVTSVTIV